MDEAPKVAAFLVRQSGLTAGKRYPLLDPVTRIGRYSKSDVVVYGYEAAIVSSKHAEIRKEGDTYRIYDLDSKNGTYLDGERITEAELKAGSIICLSSVGPEFVFHIGAYDDVDLDETIVASAKTGATTPESEAAHEELLTKAVRTARLARLAGKHGETMVIMREMLGTAIHRSGKKLKRLIVVLLAALVVVSAYSAWRIYDLKKEKGDIDRQILEIEAALQQGGQDSAEFDDLFDRLSHYEEQARKLQDSMFYRFGVEGREEAFIKREIRALLAEFGAERYSIPPEFVEQVKRFVDRYQTRDRASVERVAGSRREDFNLMRSIFEEQKLPPDLAYMVLVESAFITQSASPKGAAGLWQFTPATARAYGMKVGDEVDERLDLVKSTYAASKYIRDLILDFGAGSSVMLALAAYNLGPGKVRRAVRRVQDPIKQRNFWYLYRVRALPLETRQYVPKIVAAIIIGRNLEQFGF